MSDFVVSARKYRPAVFSSVVGQGHITSTLQSSIKRGQIAHAYLFTGPRGVGKTTCARIFAKAVNCTNRLENGDPCGLCESCQSFDQGRSWSIHELDAASNNSVENIRELIDKVQTPPQGGKYSVYIIDEVHMLSTAAFNAFLKTLEEPPAYAIFILATTEKHKILPTILSRCQSYDFRRITITDMVQYLRHIAEEENVSSDDESLHIIASKADGAMRDALSIFDRVVSYTQGNLTAASTAEATGALDYDSFFKTMDLAASADYHGLLNHFDHILSMGFDGGQFLGGLSEHIRNLLVAKSESTASLLDVSGSLREKYTAQASSFEEGYLLNALQLISTADSGYRTSVNQRLHVELALMKLGGLKKKDSDPYSIEWQVLLSLPSSSEISGHFSPQSSTVSPKVSSDYQTNLTMESNQNVAGSAQLDNKAGQNPPVLNIQKTETTKVSGKSIPNFSFTGNMTASSYHLSSNSSQIEEYVLAPDTDQTASLVRSNWHFIIEYFDNLGKIRIGAALSHAEFIGNHVIVTVANKAIEQEILDLKSDILEKLFKIISIRVALETRVTEDAVFVSKPVSDSQRLAAMMEHNAAVRDLCNELKLRL